MTNYKFACIYVFSYKIEVRDHIYCIYKEKNIYLKKNYPAGRGTA